MATVETRRLKLWQGRIETEVEIAGKNGPPLVYLHGPWGLAPDRAFVARLADSNTVYAPKFPGTSRGDAEAAHALDNDDHRGEIDVRKHEAIDDDTRG